MTDRHADRQTDASDLIICSTPCNSNGTDKNKISCGVFLGFNLLLVAAVTEKNALLINIFLPD